MRTYAIIGKSVNGSAAIAVPYRSGNVDAIAFSGLPMYGEGQLVTLGESRLTLQNGVYVLRLPATTTKDSAIYGRLRVQYGATDWYSAPFAITVVSEPHVITHEELTDEVVAARGREMYARL